MYQKNHNRNNDGDDRVDNDDIRKGYRRITNIVDDVGKST